MFGETVAVLLCLDSLSRYNHDVSFFKNREVNQNEFLHVLADLTALSLNLVWRVLGHILGINASTLGHILGINASTLGHMNSIEASTLRHFKSIKARSP